MFLTKDDALAKAEAYAHAEGIAITGVLGFGIDGFVFRTDRGTAIKVFGATTAYRTEVKVYVRLYERKVTEVHGHAVPELLNSDANRRIIEMSIVRPPYLLDFAKATLDRPPDLEVGGMEMWLEDRAERFDEHEWTVVESILETLKLWGIYLTDINPDNIRFREPER